MGIPMRILPLAYQFANFSPLVVNVVLHALGQSLLQLRIKFGVHYGLLHLSIVKLSGFHIGIALLRSVEVHFITRMIETNW